MGNDLAGFRKVHAKEARLVGARCQGCLVLDETGNGLMRKSGGAGTLLSTWCAL